MTTLPAIDAPNGAYRERAFDPTHRGGAARRGDHHCQDCLWHLQCREHHYVLRNLGIDYLVIYRVVTDQCVESAIRDAADRGYLVTQVEDCCAAQRQENHAASVEPMRGHYCRTRTTDQVIGELAGA
jgi:nicotinamidase-related amidase